MYLCPRGFYPAKTKLLLYYITPSVANANVSWLVADSLCFVAAIQSTKLNMYFYENAIYCCFHSFRYDQGRDNSQHYLNDYEDNPSRDNEELSSYYPGTLESSKNSGLSSSSYELSQYINGAEHSKPVTQSVHTSDAGEHTGKAVFSQVHLTEYLSWRMLFCASYLLRAWTEASDGSSSEVLNPSCGCQLWASRPTDTGHSALVHTGERQPAGNSQSGSRFNTSLCW